MTILRHRHWLDEPHPTIHGRRTRKIQNYIHYRDANGEYNLSDDNAEPEIAGAPHQWQGAYDFQRRLLNAGPLQVFVGDASTPGNTALIGMRPDDDPTKWLNLKLLNVNPVEPNFAIKRRAVIWPAVQNNLALVAQFARHKLSLWCRISGPRALNQVRFAVRQPDGFGFTVHDNSWVSFEDASGMKYLRTQPKYGVIGTMAGPSEDIDVVRFAVTISEGAPITVGARTLRTLVVAWDAVAVAAILASGGVAWVDPTTTISGTSSIEDNMLLSGSPGSNYGGLVSCVTGYYSSSVPRSLLRIATSAIPLGSISSVTLNIYRGTAVNSDTGDTLNAYAVKTANTGWIEGTGTPATQAASCWNYHTLSSQAWAGSVGCGTSGTDYDASADGSVAYTGPFKSGADYLVQLSLLPATFQDWKSGARTNDGLLLRSTTESGDTTHETYFLWRSTEYTADGTKVPSVEIVYTLITPIIGTPKFLFFKII